MRFHLIDALRGVAALWVVFFHAYEGGHLPQLTELLPHFLVLFIFEWGDAGVPIFFVISGFVIAHSITKDEVDGKYILRFAVRRSIRLDPPYWGSIVLVVGMTWLSATVQNEAMEWPGYQEIIAHLFYAQGILGMEHINVIYWTLCLEIQFYLVFVFLFLCAKRIDQYLHHGGMFVFLVAAIVSLLWPLRIVVSNIHPGLFLPHWHAFLIGVFAYWSWRKRIPGGYFYAYSAVIVASSYVYKSDFGMAAGLTALFVHTLANAGKIEAANWRWLQFLGAISYSLYLTHNPITGASYFVVYRVIGHSLMAEFIALLVSTSACIGFAFVFWWLFERWSISLSKKIVIHKRAQVD
ncbi:acyltransferase [Mangrovimicrobium sediminis]|uniref:Acyltransferase n=1 Tax=Mangrovimicrobium sediminis TaxID=2562682 RepID=A0A4Z0LYS3_9GAMM|nr:acyltransferase [Haliea sp. SAOS-164]TGD72326.1 acyltransferase [Haliea sp. SAOS-164]